MTEEIISQIKRNLSGNPDLDRDYLVSQLDQYKNHESAYEIIKEISGLIWQSLDFYHEENDYESNKTNVSRILDEVIPLIENRDKKTALEKLDNFMSHTNCQEVQSHIISIRKGAIGLIGVRM